MGDARDVTSPVRLSVEWSVASHPLDAAEPSGDAHVVVPVENGLLICVLDALGHGPEAAQTAAAAAIEVERHASAPVMSLIQRSHEALIGTRGVVLSLALFDFTERTMTWVGIGDVAGILVFGDATAHPPRLALVHRGGIVGGRLPQSRPWVIPVNAGDTLLFATDGVRSGFDDDLLAGASPEANARALLDKHSKRTDDALVLVARIVGSDTGGDAS